ncbi:MAG: NADPH:quinone reductase [Pseudomonadales bacterium]
MKAAWFESFGPAPEVMQVGEQATPVAGPGEVLVHLKTSGVNPSDVKKRAGAFPNLLDNGLVIPNSDGAGIIAAVGEGVDDSRIGQRVWVYQGQYGRNLGTTAEYIAIDECRAAALPEQASFEVGACLGIPVMTAHRCVFADGSVEGKTVLVTGGAGRVGYYAIQWAKQSGATVVATASNEADKQTCLDVGADHVVNHRQDNWHEQVLACTGGNKVDRIVEVEFGANLPTALQVINVGGTIATYSSTVVKEPKLPFIQMMFMDLTLRMVIVYAIPEQAKQDAIRDINAALASNSLQHRIAHVLPMDETAQAQQLIENGGFGGCVVVNCDSA